jgi:hypothetical protein
MEEIARDTGGRAYLNTNDLEGAIRQAIQDGAVAYSLGFYIDENSLDEKFHELRVRVKQRNYDLRYPRGYFASRDPGDGESERPLGRDNYPAGIASDWPDGSCRARPAGSWFADD